jgi:hypothetical protein
MAREKWLPAVAAVALTADGTVRGLLQVESVAGFKVKHRAVLASTTQPNLLVEVKQIIDQKTLVVGDIGKGIDQRIDVSAYLTADSATIEAPLQKRASIPLQEIERTIYEEEPTVARRVINVDRWGNLLDRDFTTRLEEQDTDVFLMGKALPGSDESAPVWQISQITIDGDDVTTLWAGGSSDFNLRWSDRLTLTFS